jgi:hypothetical protein
MTMEPICLEVHPVYGAIYKDGEYVQCGAVLGLSVDTREVVVAPVSGWVRLDDNTTKSLLSHPQGLRVEIWQRMDDYGTAEMPSVLN